MWIGRALTFALSAAFCLDATAAAPVLVELKDPAAIPRTFPSNAHVRVLNVWATWCVPCVEEMADLRKIGETFPKQVSIVGVSLDDMIPGDRSAIKRRVTDFLQERRISYPNIYYSGKADALGDYLKFDGQIPITIVFDRDGKELWRHQGKIDREQTSAAIRKMLRRTR